MLPEHYRERLTAAIDGELSAAERSALRRLLRDSAEARELFARLKQDAQRVRGLKPVRPPSDIASEVVQAIADRALSPTPLPPHRSRRWLGWTNPAAWATISAAAAILLSVGVGTYLYFVGIKHQPPGSPNNLARQHAPEQADTRVLPRDAGEAVVSPSVPERGPAPRDKAIEIARNDRPELLPDPRVAPMEAPLTNPAALEDHHILQVIPGRMPLILPLHDLDQAYPKRRLREELGKDEIIRLDLFCKDSTRGAELLQAVMKARGQYVIVEAQAADRLKKKQQIEYLFYTEAMTAKEVTALLEQLGLEDKKAEQKKSGEGQFDNFVLAPFQAADLEKLARLLGVPTSQLKPPARKEAGVDIRRPISENTGAALADALSKSSPSAKNGGKLTLVLPFSLAAGDPHRSKEIKQFLEKRGERKAGTTPLMLVLKPLSS
jgi:negative regulator of sigma E activity